MRQSDKDRWRGPKDDHRLIKAYEKIRGCDGDESDWRFLMNYAHEVSHNKAIRMGLSPYKAKMIAEEATFRFIVNVKLGNLNV
jgi:hypothetical protein